MSQMSDEGLRAVIIDVEGWALEARVAAYEELCRRGITDAPDPSTTPVHVVQNQDPGRGKDGRGRMLWGLVVLFFLLWRIVALLYTKHDDPTVP
jgi:hypothetical protein